MKFRLPPFFSTEERYRMSGIEALYFTLQRLGYPARWWEQVKKFGRSDSNLCSIFYHVCERIAKRCTPLLKGDWNRVSRRLEDFASAIHAKRAALTNLCVWVGGRRHRSKNMPHGNSAERRAMYSGHKRSHAVK